MTLPYYKSAALVLGLCSWSLASAELTLARLQEHEPNFDWKALERGEIVWQARADKEVDDAALVGIIAVKLPVTMNVALEYLQEDPPGLSNVLIDTRNDETVRASLEGFYIARRKDVDLEWFYKPKADGTFNVSREELVALQHVALSSRESGLDRQESLDAMEVVVRDLLAARTSEYLRKGLDGISAYDVDGSEIHPGDYLADSLKPLDLLRKEEKDFFQAFSNFPIASSC